MKNKNISRRQFGLGLVGAASAATFSFNRAQAASSSAQNQRIFCFVGGYTSHHPQGVDGNGPGITVFEMDPKTGVLYTRSVIDNIASPSFITMSADKRFLYAVSEIDDFNSKGDGSVTAFSVDDNSGNLEKLNTVSSGGAIPAHISIDHSGKYALVGNYIGGSVAVLPIKPDGSLGEATDVVKNSGPKMPDRAADNPVGNYAVSDHSGSHVHMVMSDPTGRFVVANDAGLDRMYVWTLDLNAGKLHAAKMPFLSMTPGSAPRHFVFTRDGKRLYNLCEQDSKVVYCHFNQETGNITPQQTVSSVTSRFKGSTLAAEILLSHNEKFLYASNRLGNSIAVFKISPDGQLELIDEVWMHADYGRAMMFDPTGTFLFCANQRSDSITAFRADPHTGKLEFTWNFTPVGSPTTFEFMTVPR